MVTASDFQLHIYEVLQSMLFGCLCCTQIETQSGRPVINMPELTSCCDGFIFCTIITNWFWGRKCTEDMKDRASCDFVFAYSYRCVFAELQTCLCSQNVCKLSVLSCVHERGRGWEWKGERERHREPFLYGRSVYTWPLQCRLKDVLRFSVASSGTWA